VQPGGSGVHSRASGNRGRRRESRKLRAALSCAPCGGLVP
jgi:hypothetical protein